MKATITDIDQRFSLESGAVANFVVIQLPSGRQVRAPIDDETVQAIISESQGVTPRDPVAEPEPSSKAFTHEDFDLETIELSPVASLGIHDREGAVAWEILPDSQLSPQMKKILKDSQINPIISNEDLEALKAQITERLDNKAKPGKVAWNEGPRRPISERPRRTVPMDEAGNPLPPGGIMETDPGEVQDDDDGVAQA